MSGNNKTSSSGGIGFTGLLQLALIILKLCGVIKWSWAVVLTPLWVVLSLYLLILVALWILNR